MIKTFISLSITLSIIYGIGEHILQSYWRHSNLRYILYAVFFFTINFIILKYFMKISLIFRIIISLLFSMAVTFGADNPWAGCAIWLFYLYASLLADRTVKRGP